MYLSRLFRNHSSVSIRAAKARVTPASFPLGKVADYEPDVRFYFRDNNEVIGYVP